MKQVKAELTKRILLRLGSRSYSEEYTNLPNRCLPESVLNPLNSIYESLTGCTLDPESNSYTVRSTNEGDFRAVYGPSLVRSGENLAISWGPGIINLGTNLQVEQNVETPPSFSFAQAKDFQGYNVTALVATLIADDDSVYVMEFPVRFSDPKDDSVNPSTCTALATSNKLDKLVEKLATRGNGQSDLSGLEGPSLKPTDLPAGQYRITKANTQEAGKFGVSYAFQLEVPEPFTFVDKNNNEVEVEDKAILWANKPLKEAMETEPVVSPTSPIVFTVRGVARSSNGKLYAEMKIDSLGYDDGEDCDLGF